LVENKAVEALFRRHGFTVIYPEHVPVERQIAMFGNASLIVGCSGSNMFNIAFLKSRPRYLLWFRRSSFIIRSTSCTWFTTRPRPSLSATSLTRSFAQHLGTFMRHGTSIWPWSLSLSIGG
jgi:hypothetical protein